MGGTLTTIILGSFIAEMVELLLQYSPTLGGVIERLYGYYRKSIFLFLSIHTGYLYILFITLKYDMLNWVMVFIIALKTFDIFTKLEMIKRLYITQDPDIGLIESLDMQMPFWLALIGPMTYPWLLYVAFT